MTIKDLFENSCIRFADRTAISFVNGSPMTYSVVREKVGEVKNLLVRMGVKKGDRIAILSHNMPNWCITYFAVVSVGAVTVPILPDFHHEEIRTILAHADCKVIFVSKKLEASIAGTLSGQLTHRVVIDDFSLTAGNLNDEKFSAPVEPVFESDTASIIYTSGTSGKSKGVELSHKNITFNAEMCLNIQNVHEQDVFLSILPLSHAYENTIGFLLPIMRGASIYYLEKPPTASILIPALEKIRPTTMLSVPMVIEKIYRNQILPKFTGNIPVKMLYRHVPLFRKLMHRIAGIKLRKTFGGRLRFFGIGGSKIDAVAERFLKEARFPYAIGYGLTETAPLIAGANPSQVHYQAVGPVLHGVQIRIDNPDPRTGIGEVVTRGDNLMKGYYRDAELTQSVLTGDGWFRTGDLGCFDRKNRLHLKGRLKTMILGASGENIYPEDIESIINNLDGVVESLVIEKKGKLVAMVHLNYEELEKQYRQMRADTIQYITERTEEWNKQLDRFLNDLKRNVNTRLNRFSQIHSIIAVSVPFEKTPTKKIKRYLYAH